MTLLPGGVQEAGAQPPGLTLAEILDAAFPICYVVEPDALWAERAIEALLDERTRRASVGEFERTVARWTRAGGWKAVSGYAFALAGEAEGSSMGPVRDQVARLAACLVNGSHPGRGPHPLDASTFSLRGLQPEIGDPAAAEILADAAHRLAERGATLLIELDSRPATAPAWTAAAALGPVVRVPDEPLLRYAEPARTVLEAAGATCDPESELPEITAALAGLTLIQANAVARLVSRTLATSRSPGPVLALVAACRERVRVSFAGER